MKRLLLASGVALASLTGCWPDTGPDYHGETPDPADLTVRQSPSGSVRVGDTVTFTAVFKDSLNPKWEIRWDLTSADPAQQFKQGRQVTWIAPNRPGTHFGDLRVTRPDGPSRAILSFNIVIAP